MRRGSLLDRSVVVGTTPVPIVIAGLMGVLLACSVLGAVFGRLLGREALIAGALVPDAVFHGQLWRLVSFVFFDYQPISLIFAILGVWWFGNGLARAWGGGRLLLRLVAVTTLAGAITCGLAFVWPSLLPQVFIGPWAMVTALLIAWASVFPNRQILVYFVVPMSGKTLVWATLGGTLLFALLGDPRALIPEFAAQILTLVYMRETALSDLWLHLRSRMVERRWRRRTAHLQRVDPPDEPPRWVH